MQKTIAEIFQEFEDTYVKNPSKRAEVDGTCKYFDHHTGNMCAVGRCMEKPSEHYNMSARELNLHLVEKGGLDSALKPEYRGHPILMWQELQRLHDDTSTYPDDRYWNHKGLTETGQKELARLKLKWITNSPSTAESLE